METWQKWTAGIVASVVILIVVYYIWKWWKKPAA